MIRRVAVAAAVLSVVGWAAGACGVPVNDEPRAVDALPGPLPGVPSRVPVQPGVATERLCLVRDGFLAAVTRSVSGPISVEHHLHLLVRGPNEAERAAGYTSVLTAGTTVRGVTQSRGTVTVNLADTPEDAGRSDDILAYGQIVCTLTTRPSVAAVAFTSDGEPLGVPRADGSLSPGPLTAADYAPLFSSD